MAINSKTYLTRKMLNRIFKKELTQQEVEDLVFDGTLDKHFSYYKATETLLRELNVIPDTVRIIDFNKLAKSPCFVMRELQEIFNNCNKDTVLIVVQKYFYKKHNYFYKNEAMEEIVLEGGEEIAI